MKHRRTSLVLALLVLLSLEGCFFGSKDEAPSQGVHPPKILEPEKTDPWVLIDSETDQLIVHRKGAAPIVFKNIAFGAAGVKEKQRVGDDVTPRGSYRVGWIRNSNKFETFIGLTYPSLPDAERGYRRGVINLATYERIKGAHVGGRMPPQDTRLGGFIGIHGVGKGSLEIHRLANWTAGCIAVENSQIEELARLVRPGTQVEIR
jgi:murein L,D-transpeptidase YafK